MHQHLASSPEKENSNNFVTFNMTADGGVWVIVRDSESKASITLTKENFKLLVKNLCQHI